MKGQHITVATAFFPLFYLLLHTWPGGGWIPPGL